MFTGARGDLPPYLEGYSPDHIATIMSLSKCPSYDSAENLEAISDSELNNYIRSRPSDQVEEVTSGSEGGVSARSSAKVKIRWRMRMSKSRARRRLKVRVWRPKSPKCWGDQVWVMALGIHDGASRCSSARVPRCGVVDVETCDNILTLEQLARIHRTFNVPSRHKFILPSLGRRIVTPPDGVSPFMSLISAADFLSPTSFTCQDNSQLRHLCQSTHAKFLYVF
ncbi:UNVERIFIED_CONTAM: hypothetical protein Sradi_0729000 [Sesamum radiatum]|uniref:Uncharacterized protein n=1 Tax=Sesamum radiatum TaxID=300843 RepID=A0AAW2VQH6_SESRA